MFQAFPTFNNLHFRAKKIGWFPATIALESASFYFLKFSLVHHRAGVIGCLVFAS